MKRVLLVLHRGYIGGTQRVHIAIMIAKVRELVDR
jgi:hypothetical protein